MAKHNNNSITTLSYADTLAVLRAALFTPTPAGWGLPYLLVGGSGVGKSAGITALAKSCGLDGTLALIGSQCDPTDFGGVPSADPANPGYVLPLLPRWVRTLDAWQGGSVLFCDELTCVPKGTQAAILNVVLERRSGDHQFRLGTRVLAACNPPELAVGGTEIDPPMANRFGHLRWESAPVSTLGPIWASRLAGACSPTPRPVVAPAESAASIEARVLAAWPTAVQRAAVEVESFLGKTPDEKGLASWLCVQPEAGDPAGSGAWPSPRTWEMAISALASSRIHGLSIDQRDGMLSSLVGQSAALALTTWLREADLPDTQSVLDGTVAWSPQPERPDRTQAVFRGMSAFLRGDTSSTPAVYAERCGRYWRAAIAADTAGCVDLALDSALLVTSARTALSPNGNARSVEAGKAPNALEARMGGLRAVWVAISAPPAR